MVVVPPGRDEGGGAEVGLGREAENVDVEADTLRQMGNKRVTQRGLEVVELIPDQNLMLLRGSVPGPKGGTVEVRTDG